MTKMIKAEQKAICEKYGTEFSPPKLQNKLGISLNVRNGVTPLNGMRHAPKDGTSGWYIWAGEEFSEATDFFQPLHHSHVDNWCPEISRYLALPAGWRFLVAGDYEDIWFDESLLIP